MRGRRYSILAAAVFGCAGGWASAQIQTSVAPVVPSGDVAPGTGGETFFSFNTPVINSGGYSVFSGKLNAVSSSVDQGIWAGKAGALSLVAREGNSAPDSTGSGSVGTFARVGLDPLTNPLVESTSQVVFFGWLQGSGITSGVNDTGLWTGTPGNIKLAARTGDIAPGTSNESWTFVSESAFIASGKMAFWGIAKDQGNFFSFSHSGVWAGSFGNITNYALEGQQAGDAPAGVNYGLINDTPVINTSGMVAFRGKMTGTGITSNVNDRGIWVGPDKANMKLVAQKGTQAPGLSTGVNYGDLVNQLAMNSSGTIAFATPLTGSGVDETNDTAIYTAAHGVTPSLIARESNPAPGLGAGISYGQLGSFVVINGAGKLAYIADLTGTGVDSTNDKAVFCGLPNSIAPVTRKGNTAPGTPNGVSFSDFTFSVTMNGSGQVAFVGNLTGTGVVSGNNSGIWGVDPFGQLVKVAREGDTIDLGNAGNKTIGDFGLAMFLNSGGGDGRWTSFNDAGQISFSTFFTDNSRAVINARIGGSARASASAPTLGPSTTNNFFTSSPLPLGTLGTVSGEIGYLKFASVQAGSNLVIYLDFNGTNTAGAVAELNRDAGVYGYSVTAGSFGDFDAIITYAGATGAEQYFYWNFANIDNVSLVGVQIYPEPGSLMIMGAGSLFILSRRGRRVTRREQKSVKSGHE